MEWIIAAILLLVALAILPVMLRSVKRSVVSGGFVGGLVMGLAAVLDGKAAVIAEETRKAEELESEDESGDQPHG